MKKNKTVVSGERDENGEYKIPYTYYGLKKNLGYLLI